jgi:signal transduction histidine kinase
MNIRPLHYLINVGIAAQTHKVQANRIRLVNLLALFPTLPYAFAIVYCWVYNYPRIIFTASIAVACIIITLLLNFWQRYSLAKSFIICTNAATVVVFFKLMADERSMFFFFFPLILSLLVFYDLKEEKKYLWGATIFLLMAILLCIFLPNQLFNPFPLSRAVHQFIFFFSAIVSVLLMAVYLYVIFRASVRNERILTKAKVVAEEASQAKALFLSNMSHELRTPLNGIIGTTHILQSEQHLPSQKNHIAVLSNLSDHMMSLVNDVLDYSKIESGKLELAFHRFNVGQLMDKVEGTFRHTFLDKKIGYNVVANTQLRLIDIYSDQLRLQQVLYNLVSNALKFTEEGSVMVRATLIKLTEVEATISFSVEDTGIGINAAMQDKIFESFSQGDSATTRKYGGTGLGLSISNNLVRLFKSKLSVNSEQGKGSSFYFEVLFPLATVSKNETSDKGHPAIKNQLKAIKILLAEDNPINMMIAKKVLEQWDVQVTEATNGRIAVDKCKVEYFDMLLIDVEMPEMDGRAAMAAIRKFNSNIPSIAFTAAVYENMREDLKGVGFDDYLLKPFKPEDMYEKIVGLLQVNSVSYVI